MPLQSPIRPFQSIESVKFKISNVSHICTCKCCCRYFDRYRDKKDIAEEVLSMRLDKKNPFTRHPRQEQFPLIHRAVSYKPSWLKIREDKMRLRQEQYKDLP